MSVKHKRPSSARRNIKQELFSPFVSLTRLRHIQMLLSERGSDSEDPDAVLCIAGIDARYNEGMQELLNYLLFDFFEVRKHEIERSGFEEEVVEDVMILIRKNSVDVYCNPVNYMYFLPYISHWRNLHIHCMNDSDYEDEEKAEEFKIISFIAMTTYCNKIAIPFHGSNHQQQSFDVMAIEKWPIVQAFALEGMGGGGFFTMKFNVEDISERLCSIYQFLDPVKLESIVTEHLPLHEKQWQNLISNVEVSHGDKVKNLTGSYLLEPLKSYFTHGRINSAQGSQRKENERYPFVLVGTESTKTALLKKSFTSTTDSIMQLGIDKTAAFHMVCQAVSPKSPICCRRTYFLSNGVLPYPVFGTSEEVHKVAESNDIRLLMLIYMACIEAVLASIQMYTETLDTRKAEQTCMETLLEYWENAQIPLSSSFIANRENIEFSLSAFDGQNRSITLSDKDSRLHVKSISLTVFDIPSVEHRSQTLGSISFGESFLNSYLDIELSGGTIDLDGEAAILTSPIPQMISWQTSNKETAVLKNIYQELDQETGVFGEQMINGEQVSFVCEGKRELLITDGSLHLYEEGLVYIHPHHGVVIVPKAEMTALHFYDGDSPSIVSLLVVSHQEHIQNYLPLQMRSQYNRFIIAFLPKSKAYKHMFSHVLPRWKEKNEKPALQFMEDELPMELKTIHTKLQETFRIRSGSKLTPLKKSKEEIEGLKSLIPHFEGSSVGSETVPKKHVPLISGKEWDEGSFSGSPEELIVTILAGLPGSGKRQLCQVLKRLVKNDSQWAILQFPVDVEQNFDKEVLHTHLRSTYLAYKNRKNSGSVGSKMRAILVTPGFTDTVDLIQAIVSHPDKELSKRIKIGAVTVCINPQCAYMCDRYTFPKLLDQCAQGWVNNIVFTSSVEPKDELLDQLQTTVRAVNSNVALLLAKNAEVTRSTDIDLILSDSAFSNDDLVRARYLSCPGWWKGGYNSGQIYPVMSEVILHFSQPLEKIRLTTRLRGLKSSHSKYPFDGNVYHIRGRVTFTESPQIYEIEFMSEVGSLSVHPAGRQTTGTTPSNTVVFTGVTLCKEKLKDWLRGCAKQKPEKKLHRKRNNLNRVEINRIHKENHLKSLPEGWFYNGSQYVSLAGDKSDFHPDLEVFLENYLEKINKEVDLHNANIERQHYPDLFE